ncbi:hypothetical protein FRC12_018407 [Ceratobasidium sp. 428]|nr:hypothetical protein FRC12_018407 [Ceratobasidium sp. 428]
MVSLWLEHSSLPSYISQKEDFDRCKLSMEIADGLAYLHGIGIVSNESYVLEWKVLDTCRCQVHGDLKGLNVLISDDGVPMLTDFGNAVLQDCTLNFTTTTQKNSLSPRWAAPELLDEREGTYSLAADVYALGMTILETFTGQVPYFGKSEFGVLSAVTIRKEIPPRPQEYIPSDSQQGDLLWLLLKRCWANNPDDRPDSSEIAETLHGISSDGLVLVANHGRT